MTPLETVLAEIDAELARLAPIDEGLHDYAALDLTSPTVTEVQAAIALYHERITVLMAAKLALEALIAQGYPALEIPPVAKAVYDDLVANRNTIEAALAEFTVIAEATSASIEWTEPRS